MVHFFFLITAVGTVGLILSDFFSPVFLPDGWLHSLELGFYVGFNVGHIERAINGDLEGLSAIKLMANMCWMEVLAGIKKEHDV